MDISVFTDKSHMPSIIDMENAIGETFKYWNNIVEYVHQKYPKSFDEWAYPGAKYGWSFRIKDNKRVIIYLLPHENFFKVAFMFGQKATDAIMASNVASCIKAELNSAKVYIEGRGIRIDVKDQESLNDIKQLIDIKLS